MLNKIIIIIWKKRVRDNITNVCIQKTILVLQKYFISYWQIT